jgi:predicted house-cleaning noncanonical NTP pyrophosphatase (MazG superfamily)
MKGKKCNFKILNNNEYLKELDKKLFEEAHEFIEEHSIEELADLMEVIFAIMKNRNISIEDIESARKIKNNKKGLFNDKIYLIDVEQEEIDEREENEMKKEWRKNT